MQAGRRRSPTSPLLPLSSGQLHKRAPHSDDVLIAQSRIDRWTDVRGAQALCRRERATKGAEDGLQVAGSVIDGTTQMDSMALAQRLPEVSRHRGALAEDHVLVEIVVAGARHDEWPQAPGRRQHLIVQECDLLAASDRV